MRRTAACAQTTTLSKPRSRSEGSHTRPLPCYRNFPTPFPIGGSIRLDSSYSTIRTRLVRGERRHARDTQHATSFRTRFFGRLLAWTVVWNTRRLGRGMFSALRLHQLLRSARLHLCSARSVRLPTLRAAGELFSPACLLHVRHPPRTDHGAVSAGNGSTPMTVSFRRRRPMGCQQPDRVICIATGRKSWRHRRACPGDLDQDGTVHDCRDGRDKPGHDRLGVCHEFCPWQVASPQAWRMEV